MNKNFQEGLAVFDEAIKEVEAQLSAMDGVCKECAENSNKIWPQDTSKCISGPCHSCGEKTDTILIPWNDLEERK